MNLMVFSRVAIDAPRADFDYDGRLQAISTFLLCALLQFR
jgi:hypothetical protein